MVVLFIIVGVLYAVFMITMIAAWHSIQRKDASIGNKTPLSISVIVPVRNEEESLLGLLNQIISQDYSVDRFEVIIVNDHSTDHTVSIVQKVIENSTDNIRLLNLKDYENGKKAALGKGIKETIGDIIVTTDGDCEVGSKWLKSIASVFDDSVQLVFGPVAIRSSTFFGKLQMIDFAALIGIGAATWKLGKPGMCNGANLAFRKKVFEECNGYEGSERHPSGDDEFFLRKVFEKYPKGIRFLKETAAVVKTNPQPNFRSFIQQRIRWAGKWKLHRDFTTKLTALFMFLFYIVVLVGTSWALITQRNIDVVVTIWGVKWILDIILVSAVLKLSDQKIPLLGKSGVIDCYIHFTQLVLGSAQ